MPISKENIKKALDHFENDEYVEAKDIISKEVSTYKDEWLKNKLELKSSMGENIDEGLLSKFKNGKEMIKLFRIFVKIEEDDSLSMEEKQEKILDTIKKSNLDPKVKKGYIKIMADQFNNAF